jgi:uncharacterized protein YjbI with pentapeptide repeats
MSQFAGKTRDFKPEDLGAALEQHATWLASHKSAGACLDLEGVDLEAAQLAGKDLRLAKLARANLRHADLSGAILIAADLSGANLSYATVNDAELQHSNLSGANLEGAKCNKAVMRHANLSNARLFDTVFEQTDLRNADCTRANGRRASFTAAQLEGTLFVDADLRDARGLELDASFLRGAQFLPVGMRSWAFLCNHIFPHLSRFFNRLGCTRLTRSIGFPKKHNDPWSVLRQLYAGPRLFFLFLFVIVFALPYVGRVAFYSAVGPVERRLAAQAESRKHELEARLVANPSDRLARLELDQLSHALAKVEPRPVWQVLLRWDEGNAWPTVLAALLILYNFGLYYLISSVSPLRDEEERSGWSPAWDDYKWLICVHRLVTGLFYVSLISFVLNVWQLLFDVVFVVKPG